MDAAAKEIASARGAENPLVKAGLDHSPSHPGAGVHAGFDAVTPWPETEMVAIHGFVAPERSFNGIQDLMAITLDKPSGETDRPETAVFRISRSAILDPGGAIQGTDAARAQSLIREAAELPSPSDKMAFLRQNRIAVVADYSTHGPRKPAPPRHRPGA